jgi:hypothetical protein
MTKLSYLGHDTVPFTPGMLGTARPINMAEQGGKIRVRTDTKKENPRDRAFCSNPDHRRFACAGDANRAAATTNPDATDGLSFNPR